MKMKKINIKSNSGFTMTDLVIAIVIFITLTGTVSSLMYAAFKTNLQAKLSASATNYAIQILEDIDKISYDEVENGMESSYMNKFSISPKYDLSIEVSNYTESNYKEDMIKKVKLTLSYELGGNPESIVIEKLKVKEI